MRFWFINPADRLRYKILVFLPFLSLHLILMLPSLPPNLLLRLIICRLKFPVSFLPIYSLLPYYQTRSNTYLHPRRLSTHRPAPTPIPAALPLRLCSIPHVLLVLPEHLIRIVRGGLQIVQLVLYRIAACSISISAPAAKGNKIKYLTKEMGAYVDGGALLPLDHGSHGEVLRGLHLLRLVRNVFEDLLRGLLWMVVGHFGGIRAVGRRMDVSGGEEQSIGELLGRLLGVGGRFGRGRGEGIHISELWQYSWA